MTTLTCLDIKERDPRSCVPQLLGKVNYDYCPSYTKKYKNVYNLRNREMNELVLKPHILKGSFIPAYYLGKLRSFKRNNQHAAKWFEKTWYIIIDIDHVNEPTNLYVVRNLNFKTISYYTKTNYNFRIFVPFKRPQFGLDLCKIISYVYNKLIETGKINDDNIDMSAFQIGRVFAPGNLEKDPVYSLEEKQFVDDICLKDNSFTQINKEVYDYLVMYFHKTFSTLGYKDKAAKFYDDSVFNKQKNWCIRKTCFEKCIKGDDIKLDKTQKKEINVSEDVSKQICQDLIRKTCIFSNIFNSKYFSYMMEIIPPYNWINDKSYGSTYFSPCMNMVYSFSTDLKQAMISNIEKNDNWYITEQGLVAFKGLINYVKLSLEAFGIKWNEFDSDYINNVEKTYWLISKYQGFLPVYSNQEKEFVLSSKKKIIPKLRNDKLTVINPKTCLLDKIEDNTVKRDDKYVLDIGFNWKIRLKTAVRCAKERIKMNDVDKVVFIIPNRYTLEHLFTLLNEVNIEYKTSYELNNKEKQTRFRQIISSSFYIASYSSYYRDIQGNTLEKILKTWSSKGFRIMFVFHGIDGYIRMIANKYFINKEEKVRNFLKSIQKASKLSESFIWLNMTTHDHSIVSLLESAVGNKLKIVSSNTRYPKKPATILAKLHDILLHLDRDKCNFVFFRDKSTLAEFAEIFQSWENSSKYDLVFYNHNIDKIVLDDIMESNSKGKVILARYVPQEMDLKNKYMIKNIFFVESGKRGYNPWLCYQMVEKFIFDKDMKPNFYFLFHDNDLQIVNIPGYKVINKEKIDPKEYCSYENILFRISMSHYIKRFFTFRLSKKKMKHDLLDKIESKRKVLHKRKTALKRYAELKYNDAERIIANVKKARSWYQIKEIDFSNESMSKLYKYDMYLVVDDPIRYSLAIETGFLSNKYMLSTLDHNMLYFISDWFDICPHDLKCNQERKSLTKHQCNVSSILLEQSINLKETMICLFKELDRYREGKKVDKGYIKNLVYKIRKETGFSGISVFSLMYFYVMIKRYVLFMENSKWELSWDFVFSYSVFDENKRDFYWI